MLRLEPGSVSGLSGPIFGTNVLLRFLARKAVNSIMFRSDDVSPDDASVLRTDRFATPRISAHRDGWDALARAVLEFGVDGPVVAGRPGAPAEVIDLSDWRSRRNAG